VFNLAESLSLLLFKIAVFLFYLYQLLEAAGEIILILEVDL
jgi:hypothetical protein